MTQATECNSNDCQIEEVLDEMLQRFAGFPKIREKIRAYKKKQNEDSFKLDKIDFKLVFKKVKNFLKDTKNSIEKVQSRDPEKCSEGVLDIVKSLATLVGLNHYGALIEIFVICYGLLFLERQPKESVVGKLANIVHEEFIHFNRRLLDQKYNGLERRVLEQNSQLQTMKKGEKLDDPNLWNDYAQFLGELAIRLESPLSFKYENNLSQDPAVEDYVTAVVKYSEAHTCFMALLFAARAKYTELGIAHEDDIATLVRKMKFQEQDAKEKLSFLSENRYLTFLGKIEGGKITKIVALSRRIRFSRLVETVRHSLGLSPMPKSSTVESSAKKVDQQSVTLKPVEVENCSWFSLNQISRYRFSIQFINDVDLPMKIVSNELVFEKNVPPRESYRHEIDSYFSFSAYGYITLYFNGNMSSSNEEPPRKVTRVIEFAATSSFFSNKIGMQDKTYAEFTRGHDTDKRSKDAVPLYFSEYGKYYNATAEISSCWPTYTWRFTIQDFDPEAVH